MENYLDALLSGPVPRELSFPAEEYAARLARVRETMAAREIDVLLVHSAVDLCYLTGYQTLWPDAYACLVVPLAGPPFMQVGEIEASCAVLHGEIRDFVLFDWVGADAVPGQLAQLLADRGFAQSRIGVQAGRIEMGNRGPLDARLLDTLRAKLDAARFVDATLADVRCAGDEIARRARAHARSGADHHGRHVRRRRGDRTGQDRERRRRRGRPCHDRRGLGVLLDRPDRQRRAPDRLFPHHLQAPPDCRRRSGTARIRRLFPPLHDAPDAHRADRPTERSATAHDRYPARRRSRRSTAPSAPAAARPTSRGRSMR